VYPREALDAIARAITEGPITEPERERGREAIYDALKAKDPLIRGLAINSIGWIDGEAATDAVLRMVNDSHPAVRQQALHSLGTVGKPSAAAKLENLLVARRNSLKLGERGRDGTRIVGTQTLARMRKRGQGLSLMEIVDEEWRTSLEAVKNNKGTPIPRP
jgi:HEAT repeat protein